MAWGALIWFLVDLATDVVFGAVAAGDEPTDSGTMRKYRPPVRGSIAVRVYCDMGEAQRRLDGGLEEWLARDLETRLSKAGYLTSVIRSRSERSPVSPGYLLEIVQEEEDERGAGVVARLIDDAGNAVFTSRPKPIPGSMVRHAFRTSNRSLVGDINFKLWQLLG